MVVMRMTAILRQCYEAFMTMQITSTYHQKAKSDGAVKKLTTCSNKGM